MLGVSVRACTNIKQCACGRICVRHALAGHPRRNGKTIQNHTMLDCGVEAGLPPRGAHDVSLSVSAACRAMCRAGVFVIQEVLVATAFDYQLGRQGSYLTACCNSVSNVPCWVCQSAAKPILKPTLCVQGSDRFVG